MARADTCRIDKFVFGSDDVRNYKMDKCVSDALSVMGGDTKQCARHIVAMTHDHPQLKGCTNKDVEAICQLSKSSFTVHDAEQLCEAKLNAERVFWQNKRASRPQRPASALASTCDGSGNAGGNSVGSGGNGNGEVTSAHATAAGRWRRKNPSYYEGA